MYCPKCGQQQVSDEMRFCSRCGLPMSGLADWIASGGVPSRQTAETKVPSLSPRRKGIRRGAKLMFVSGVLAVIFLGLSLALDDGAPMILPGLLFFVGLFMTLYSRLFSEDIAPISDQQAQTSRLKAMAGASALPPASNIPMHGPGNYEGQRVRTNELAQPPSVTEHTTKLLDQE